MVDLAIREGRTDDVEASKTLVDSCEKITLLSMSKWAAKASEPTDYN
jgi:hypothetical protein